VRSRPGGLAAALVFLFPAAAAVAADAAVGSISYLEGGVTLERDEAGITNAAIGQDVQNFDMIRTDSDGLVELAISTPQSPRMTVKISADTQFTLEITAIKGTQQTSLGIIGGTIALKVARLTATQDVRVKTDSVAMGVRGTQFTVTAAGTGDILVTCDEGDVVCTDDQGKELHSVPGSVVEKRPGELYRVVPVAASGLETFRSTWAAEREQTLRTNALKLLRQNALLYRQLTREMNAASVELARSQKILDKWRDEDRRGRIGQRFEIARERLAIGGLLVRMRQIQFRLERVEFRLLRLKRYFDRGELRGAVDAATTSEQFFTLVSAERADVERKLALARYVAKLYAKRNGGGLP
jgi:hypothetical protein